MRPGIIASLTSYVIYPLRKEGSPVEIKNLFGEVWIRHPFTEEKYPADQRLICSIRWRPADATLVLHFPFASQGSCMIFDVPSKQVEELMTCEPDKINAAYYDLLHTHLLRHTESIVQIGPCFGHGRECCKNPEYHTDEELHCLNPNRPTGDVSDFITYSPGTLVAA